MADPVIPNIPPSSKPEDVSFFTAIKTAMEFLLGHGRSKDADRAVRVKELTDLKNSLVTDIVHKVNTGGMESQETPDPPRNLRVTKGIFVHNLTWDNPDDEIVSHIEIWVAEGSQNRDEAVLVGIVTVTKDLMGKQGHFVYSGFDVTKDLCYWIRSVSFAGNHSEWCPPDDQGGYVVPGEESIEEFISKILDLLTGRITENELYIDLSSRIDHIEINSQAILNEIQDRINALRELEDRISADIHTEQTIRETEDEALSSEITELYAKYDDNVAAIQDEVTARTTADTAMTQQINAAFSAVGENQAAILDEVTTRITADEALTGRIDSAFSQIGQNLSAIQDEETTRVTQNTALTQRLDTAYSKIGENLTAIQTEETTRINDDNALSQRINTLQTTVGGYTTSIQTNAQAINGIKGEHTVKIDNNGHVTGYGLISDYNNGTPASEFIVLVDKFMIVTPGKNPKVPFVVGVVDGQSTVGINGNLVVDGSIYGNKIHAGSIKTHHLAAHQILVGHTIKSENFSDYYRRGWKIDYNGNATFYGGKMVIGAGSSGFHQLTDRPTDLSQLDAAAGSKLDDIEAGADKTGTHTAYDTFRVAGESAQIVKQNAADGATFTSQMAGSLAYENLVQRAMMGNTIIQGGYLRTDLIRAGSILAEQIGANQITADHVGTNEIISSAANIKDLTIDAIHLKNQIGLNGKRIGSSGHGVAYLKALSQVNETDNIYVEHNLGRMPLYSANFTNPWRARRSFQCVKVRCTLFWFLLEIWANFGGLPEYNLTPGNYYFLSYSYL